MFDCEKYDFTDGEIRDAAAHDRLLSLEIEFNRQCNYRCPYCYVGESEKPSAVYDGEIISRGISQAAALGARKIVILGGEPLIYKDMREKIQEIVDLGMGAEIFTNGSLVTQELAKFFFEHGCRVAVKLNTLDGAVHDRLTGVKNSLENSLCALDLLKDAGFTEKMLCASTVMSTENLDGIVDLWKYLRERAITPYFEIMTPQGRLLSHRSLEVDTLRLKGIFDAIQAYDNAHGHGWKAQPPLVGSKCLRHTYSALMKASGDVFPCVGVDLRIGNIMDSPLRILLSESPIIRDLKNHLNMIKGPCRACEKAAMCYGCRGAAYQMTGDYLASDPLCWRNHDKLGQIQVLPVPAAPYVPHKPPMAMMDAILEVSNDSKVSAKIREDNLFLGSDGVLDRCAIPELVSQAAAAVESFRYDGRELRGFLASGQKIAVQDDIRLGDEIVVSFKEMNTMPNWYLLTFAITKDGKLCASGEINVCQM